MRRLDKGLLLALFTLIGIGLVQVYSSSFIYSIEAEARGDGLYFFERQLGFALFGLCLLFVTTWIPYRVIRRWGWILWICSGVAVACTFVPGLGVSAGGAQRWLNLFHHYVFEPSELLKVSFSLMLATFFSMNMESLGAIRWPVILTCFGVPLVLVLNQPDFGTFAMLLVVFAGVLFAFGLRWKYIITAATVSVPVFIMLIWNKPYRRARLMAFLDPWSDPEVKGFQIIQSMLSFHSGGLAGVGLGQGQGKLFFLPEAHTDFTLAVLGEEMGFLGFLGVLSLYGYLVFRGIQIAARVEDRFSRVLALSLVLTFALSVFINVGVVLGLLPTKGLTLPFLSYGGSSLLMNCFLFGLLLNVERNRLLEAEDRKPVSSKKRSYI